MKIWAGIDPGEKRIGVARSDGLGLLAVPRAIVGDPVELTRLLAEWVETETLAGVIVGLPRNMDGTIGPIARRSLRLARRLREALPIDVYVWDERLTTQQWDKQRPRPSRGEASDDRVAALILQSYLDAGCPQPPDPPELNED